LPIERAECQGARADESRKFRSLNQKLLGTLRITRTQMAQSEIDNVRALLQSKPRPTSWTERRQRLDAIGSVWPVADDVKLEAVDVSGLSGEWSIVPGSDPSSVLMFFHGGGYCSGSILSHRRMVTEAGRAARMRTLAVAYRLAPEDPFPAAYDDALTAWRFFAKRRYSSFADRDRWRQRWRGPRGCVDQSAARCKRGTSGVRVARIALDGSDHVWFDICQQGRSRSNHS
jgi:hypothetical protein